MAETDGVCAEALRVEARKSRRRNAFRSGAWLALGGCVMLCVPMRNGPDPFASRLIGDATRERMPNFTSKVLIAGYYF